MTTTEPERPCLSCGTDPGDCLAKMNRSPVNVRCCIMCGINDVHSADAHRRIEAHLDALTDAQRAALDLGWFRVINGTPQRGVAREDLDALIAAGLACLEESHTRDVRDMYLTPLGRLVLTCMYLRAQEEAGARR